MTITTFDAHSKSARARNALLMGFGLLTAIAAANSFLLSGAPSVPSIAQTAVSPAGWHVAATINDAGPRMLTVLLLDRHGAPVPAEAVRGQLYRADDADGEFFELSFTPVGPTLWRAPAANLSGDLSLRLEVAQPEGSVRIVEQRLAASSR